MRALVDLSHGRPHISTWQFNLVGLDTQLDSFAAGACIPIVRDCSWLSRRLLPGFRALYLLLVLAE